MGAVESDSVKSARKAKDKDCERASETRERTLHGQEQNRMCMASIIDHAYFSNFVILGDLM